MKITDVEKQELIKRIKEIGLVKFYDGNDIKVFLPDLPSLGGGEFIFTIGWANAKKYIDGDVWSFVRGLHLIELRYREVVGSDFGFGSPSPTEKVIKAVEEIDEEKAKSMREWVSQNGGNYYITKI